MGRGTAPPLPVQVQVTPVRDQGVSVSLMSFIESGPASFLMLAVKRAEPPGTVNVSDRRSW